MRTPLPFAVIGSGPSGLAAALLLRREGHHVRVFEAADVAGGRMQTSRRDGFTLEHGAAAISSRYTTFRRLANEVGLGEQFIPCGTVMGFARDGRVHQIDAARLLRDGLRADLLSTRSKLALARLAYDVIRCGRRLRAENLSEAADHDTESAADYARRRHFNAEIEEFVVDGIVRGCATTSAVDVSKLDLFYAIAKFIGAKFQVLRDGMGAYPGRVAELVDIRCATPVTGVNVSGGGVDVTWTEATGERTEHFAGCVIAVPAPQVPALYGGLDPERRSFLTGTRYTRMVNLTLALDRVPRGVDAAFVVVPRSSHPGLVFMTLDHNLAGTWRAPAGQGLITCYANASWADELWDDDDDTATKKMVAALDTVLPVNLDQLSFSVVNRWTYFVPRSAPGHYQNLRRFTSASHRHDGPVQLGGDWFSCSNIDGASASGERAARDALSSALRRRI